MALVAKALSALTLGHIVACSEHAADKSNVGFNEQVQPMNPSKFASPFDAMDIGDLPSKIPATKEQNQYVVALATAAINVLLQKTTLDKEETSLFGKGEFFWHKDPSKPIRTDKSYSQDNFRMNFVSLSFVRAREDLPWTGAALSVTTKAFPRSVYQFELPIEFFSGMRRVKAFEEVRPENGSRPSHKVNVFEYVTVGGNTALNLRFESRADVTSLQAEHPTTFHLLKLTRS
jgi:hypothetical protein